MQGMCAHCAKELGSSKLTLYTSKFRSFYVCPSCLDWYKIAEENYNIYLDWKKDNEKTT